MPPATIAGSTNTLTGTAPTRRRRKSRPFTKPTGIAPDVEGKWKHHLKEGKTEMKDKLKSDWSVELDEYMEERYGIDINEVICDEVLKATLNEIQKDEEKLK